ncbi:hypothetical protein BDR26DRAFT_1013948 [Obelidium mucronatum]|nr:hypothetical protein BDR26DRAFT_1013948 [Obelidium mucronatum]
MHKSTTSTSSSRTPRLFAILLIVLTTLAAFTVADQSNYGNVHKEAEAYKAQVLEQMKQNGGASNEQHLKDIKSVDDMVLFFQLHDHNKDGHLDGHELLTVYAGQEIKVGSDGRPVEGSVTPSKLQDLFRLVDTVLDMDDTDNDGMISWEEYYASQQYHGQV